MKIQFVQYGLALIVLASLLPACSEARANSDTVVLGGAWDMSYLSIVLDKLYQSDNQSGNQSGYSLPLVKMDDSTSAISDLKKGKTDAVILGRDPTAQELNGLQDNVIGYDAVTIVIDENSYVGGINGLSSKTEGLHDLTAGDLKTLFGTGKLAWDGEFATRYPYIDRNSWLFTNLDYGWDNVTKIITPFFNLVPGKYDTQTMLYQKLGLAVPNITSNATFTDAKLNYEEELMAAEYPPGPPYKSNSGNFPFKIAFVSRRVAILALQHVAIRIVSVDGMDPVEDPVNIYNGSYPFSHKLHLLIRSKPTPNAVRLADFLKSMSGQQLLKDAGYLPVSPDLGL